jgi:hypothetical protein
MSIANKKKINDKLKLFVTNKGQITLLYLKKNNSPQRIKKYNINLFGKTGTRP